MRKSTRQFVFKRVYDMAALVEACIDDQETLNELEWEDADLLRGLGKFAKITLLHRYIYAMIAVAHRTEYRKNADLYESGEIADLERLLDTYQIGYQPYARFTSPVPPEEAASREEDPFYQWFLAQEEAFEVLWEKLTDETFHLLFANRAFLLKFNLAVAAHLAEQSVAIPAELIGDDGVIKRQPLPVWVRDAVFFRDHGRCVLCQV
jgi:hypothetical protein